MEYRQYDIPLTTQYHYSIPSDVPGRTTSQDFVYFNYNGVIPDPHNYIVSFQSYSGEFLGVAPLSQTVKLPHVHISPDSMIMLLPNSLGLPRFIGTVQRGKTYEVTMNSGQRAGCYIMK